jgi:PAS domain S-box-containing protein
VRLSFTHRQRLFAGALVCYCPQMGVRSAPAENETRRPAVPQPSPEELSARLAAIVESSDDAIISKDLNGIITSWNPSAERMFGYTAGEAIGKSIRIVIPEDRQSEEDEVLRSIVRGESVDHFETVRRRKDGSEIFISLSVSPIRDNRGTIIGASKTARDISARERENQRAAFFGDMGPILAATLDYETTLRNIARLTTTALDSRTRSFADYSIIDIRAADGSLRRVASAHRNPDKERLLEEAQRYAPDPVGSPLARPLRTGQPLFMPLLAKGDIESLSRNADHTRIMLALAPRSLITVPLTARGTTFGLFTVVRSDSPTPFDQEDLSFASEIGRRAALAVDNARLYAESQQAVRTRDHVLAVVSHDLRNSIGAIATSARLLVMASDDEPQRVRRAQTIVRACDRMNRLVQDLLDASRLQAGYAISIQSAELDGAALIRDACESFRASAEDRLIELACETPNPLPRVAADRDRMLQVLSNLLANAMKFTPEGGTISVRATSQDGAVRFSVADTGPGIRAEDLAHIFERFYQATSTARLGTGLGLPIAKGIVEAHGGRIWVESTPGVGATFHFTLPVATS